MLGKHGAPRDPRSRDGGAIPPLLVVEVGRLGQQLAVLESTPGGSPGWHRGRGGWRARPTKREAAKSFGGFDVIRAERSDVQHPPSLPQTEGRLCRPPSASDCLADRFLSRV